MQRADLRARPAGHQVAQAGGRRAQARDVAAAAHLRQYRLQQRAWQAGRRRAVMKASRVTVPAPPAGCAAMPLRAVSHNNACCLLLAYRKAAPARPRCHQHQRRAPQACPMGRPLGQQVLLLQTLCVPACAWVHGYRHLRRVLHLARCMPASGLPSFGTPSGQWVDIALHW